MPRFVVQHHILGPESEHWDFMLEVGDVLWTWSLPAPPDRPDGLPTCAVRLPDHRPAYLEYEGPVSGNRGRVAIHDRGTYRWLGETPPASSDLADLLRFEVQGSRLTGRLELQLTAHDGKDHWRLRRLLEPRREER